MQCSHSSMMLLLLVNVFFVIVTLATTTTLTANDPPKASTTLSSMHSSESFMSEQPEDPMILEAQERPYNMSEVYDLDALRTFYEGDPAAEGFIRHFFRRLVGSNCILVERAEVSPYYQCLGCRVEEAMACIDDMRLNRTGSVRANCKINSMHQRFDNTCCPTYKPSLNGKTYRWNYIGMSYPEGLRCLERVGCGDSIFYHDLLIECKRSCHDTIPDADRSVCFAGYEGMFLTNLRTNSASNVGRIHIRSYNYLNDSTVSGVLYFIVTLCTTPSLLPWTFLLIIALSCYLGLIS